MAKEVVAQLFRASQANPTLRQHLNQAPTLEKFVEMARGYGYDFTLEEWQTMTQFAVEEVPGELSEIPGL